MIRHANKTILWIILMALVIAAAVYFSIKKPIDEQGVMCTMEAKLCPDGTYVGRTGPSCDFAPCPEPDTDTTGWKSTSDSGVTFKYPETIGTTYIHTVDWPPKVQVITGPFACTDAGEENAQAGQTQNKNINGHNYCVTLVTEGAAGSIYSQYAYAREFGIQTLYFTFTLRAPQCDNYDDPQKTACKNERGSFSVDSLADKIITTAHI